MPLLLAALHWTMCSCMFLSPFSGQRQCIWSFADRSPISTHKLGHMDSLDSWVEEPFCSCLTFLIRGSLPMANAHSWSIAQQWGDAMVFTRSSEGLSSVWRVCHGSPYHCHSQSQYLNSDMLEFKCCETPTSTAEFYQCPGSGQSHQTGHWVSGTVSLENKDQLCSTCMLWAVPYPHSHPITHLVSRGSLAPT